MAATAAAVGTWASANAAAISAVTAVASVASTAYTMYASAQNAKAQEEAAENHNRQVLEQTVENYGQLSEVELEAQQQALEESMMVQEEFIQAKGKINTMAAWSGTAGMSVASQLNDLEREKYSNFNVVQLNMQAKMDNIADEAESMRYSARGAMNTQPISRPSWAQAALEVGGAALGGLTSVSKGQQLNQQGSLASSG